MGVVGGLAVALFGTCFGVHIARAADAAPQRRSVLALCLLAWSAATVSGAVASGFYSLLFSRIMVGVGEAGAIPISLAILADAYPQERRSFAMSVYYMGLQAGIIVGLFLGGWVGESAIGWRGAFAITGAPGLGLAALVYFRLREPPRGYGDRVTPAAGAQAEECDEHAGLLPPTIKPGSVEGHVVAPPRPARVPFKAQMRVLFKCNTFVCALLGAAFNLFTAIGTFFFLVPLCERRFGTSSGVVGTALSGVSACSVVLLLFCRSSHPSSHARPIPPSLLCAPVVFGAASTLASGMWADAAHARASATGAPPNPGPYALLPAASCLLSLPFGVATCAAPSFAATVLLFLPQTAAANVPSSPLHCLISTLVPPHSRAAANSVLEVGVGLAGGLGPFFVGAVSRALQRSGLSEGDALQRAMITVQFGMLPAAWFLWRASVHAAADLKASQSGEMWASIAPPPPDEGTEMAGAAPTHDA